MRHIPAGWLLMERIYSSTVAAQSLRSSELSDVSATRYGVAPQISGMGAAIGMKAARWGPPSLRQALPRGQRQSACVANIRSSRHFAYQSGRSRSLLTPTLRPNGR